MTNSTRRPIGTDDRGAVLVWVALMSVVLLGIGALAVDMGFAYATKRQLSNTADAAALAGAQVVGSSTWSDGGCASVNGAPPTPTAQMETAVNAAVLATHNANSPTGAGAPTTTISCASDGTYVDVAVSEQSSLTTFFGRVLGVSTLEPAASATARVEGINSPGALRPLTVCKDTADAAAVAAMTPTAADDIFQSNYGVAQGNGSGNSALCGGATGNWGYTDFGLSQTTTKPGNQANKWFDCLVEYGYGFAGQPDCGPGAFPVVVEGPVPDTYAVPGDRLTANTGDVDRLQKMMDSDPVYLPVADQWTGNGANGGYIADGVVTVQICGWAQPDNAQTLPVGIKQNGFGQPTDPARRCWSNDVYQKAMSLAVPPLGVAGEAVRTDVSLAVQWKIVARSASFAGGVGGACQIKDLSTCRRTLRLMK